MTVVVANMALHNTQALEFLRCLCDDGAMLSPTGSLVL